MIEFFSLKKDAFGLDISDLSLKILKFEKREKKIEVASFGESEIEKGIIQEAKVVDENKLADIIEEAVKNVQGKKIKTKNVIVSLPEERTFLFVIKIPRIPLEDIESAVVFEAQNHLPMPVENLYISSQLLTNPKENVRFFEVLVCAMEKEVVEGYFRAVQKADLFPIIFEPESIAISRALIKGAFSETPILLIDLGATRTTFAVYFKNSVKDTMTIPLSSQLFTKIIAQNLKIPLGEAERLKREIGLGEKFEFELGGERSKIFEALLPPIVDLTQQIKKFITYYQSHDSQAISKILFCGGGAQLKGLKSFLSYELEIPVEEGNPWVNLPSIPQNFPLEKTQSFTTAIGLALAGI